MTRRKVLLYNPRAEFYTMPLALIALGGALDRRRYDVLIIDGRLESNPVDRVIRETEGALCLGMTVLTGTPLHDALRVCRAVRAARPDCPIVWGGWHPSLFPIETLTEADLDATVQGQGELTFAEIVERFASGSSLAGVAGCAYRTSHGAGTNHVAVNPARPIADLNTLPAHDYSLIPVEQYFARKRQRQLDYVSSQGCRFRCTFCADPTVYNRAWFGLDPDRVGGELERLSRRYGISDVGFQDETFFTHQARVAGIAGEFLRRNLRFTWMATMRADQGSRLDDGVLSECRRAGLRRVMLGLESGSQQMLDWMKKDVKLDQVFRTADKCRRLGIAMLFNLIVGFPDEPAESVVATLGVAKQLRQMSPDFQVAIFYYKPYPGTEITGQLHEQGHRLPQHLEEWASVDDNGVPSPWVDRRKRRLVERFRFYQQVAWGRPTFLRAPLQALARWRCKHDFYQYPFEKTVSELVRPLAPQG